jgi:hypothetical protein
MATLKETIAPLLDKALLINLFDEEETLHVIDWTKIEEEHEELVSKIEGMSDAEAEAFLNSNESALMQICDYFMDDECLDRVENGEWIPFGLLGLTYRPNDYAEMGNGGMLLFDISEDEENPAIILYRDGNEEVLAENLEELVINEVEVQ